MSEELKPVLCGCGGEAMLWHIEFCEQDLYLYHCMSCDTATKFYPSEEQAAAAWNTAMSGNRMRIHTVTLAEPGEEETAKVDRLQFENEKRRVFRCQNCGQYMHRTSWSHPVKYCSYCGIKIDWSIDEDHMHE